MVSGNFLFQLRRKYNIPYKQMTKCLSLVRASEALSGYNSTGLRFWPASESRSQGQQMLHLRTCTLKNQPTVRMAERAHMSWWLTSCLLWMPFIWITEICWDLSHAMPKHGFINSKISYIFLYCSIFPKIIMHRVRARWRAERRARTLE